jgi:hypothetical protein
VAGSKPAAKRNLETSKEVDCLLLRFSRLASPQPLSIFKLFVEVEDSTDGEGLLAHVIGRE